MRCQLTDTLGADIARAVTPDGVEQPESTENAVDPRTTTFWKEGNMIQQTQAQVFIGVLTAMWREHRELREHKQRLKLEATVRRVVEGFLTKPDPPTGKPKSRIGRKVHPNGR